LVSADIHIIAQLSKKVNTVSRLEDVVIYFSSCRPLIPDRKRSEKDPPQKVKLYVSARIFRVQSTMRKQKKSHMERLVQVAKQLAASLLARHHSGIPCHAKRGDKIASDLIHPQGAKRPCYVGKADVRGRSLPASPRRSKESVAQEDAGAFFQSARVAG